ncbi:hypothetical protein Rin_00018870 [Candidatus Regiella insecticola 5.15]|uniref:Uncharacterized protein n=1 Tax=Candidatus Regiella insecticola 5.15 TaxID=1005043 RepID=G2H1E4_9ENTR|nr:hypothetical protein [Candidatus Regiella insecticola]EGY28179.1 hypothetical protein Rin_00018870 [Candidatus Regiella insecticola 5.15]
MLSNITNCLPIGVTPLERNSIQLSELIKRLDSVRPSPIQLKQVSTPLEKPLTRLEQSLIAEILELCRKAFEFIAENKIHKRIEKSVAGVRIATLVATDLGSEISTLGPAAMGLVAGWFILDYIPEIIKQIEKIACSLNQQHLHDPSLQLFLASISGMAVGNLIASLSGAKKHSIEIASVLGSLCGGLGAITGDPAKYMEIITSVGIALGLITGYSTLKPFGLTSHFKINTLKLDPSSWIRLTATIVGSAVGTLLAKPGASGEVSKAAAEGAMLGERIRLLGFCIMVLSSGDPSASSSVAATATVTVFLLRHYHTEWSNYFKELAESAINKTINSEFLPAFFKKIALYFENSPPSPFEKKFINEIISSAYNVLPIVFSATTAEYKGCSLTLLFAICNAVDAATEGQLQQKIDYLTWPLRG